MINNRICILQINADNFGKGGVSVAVWRFVNHIESSLFGVGYISARKNIEDEYVQDIVNRGGEIHKINISNNRVLKYFLRYKGVHNVLKKYNYDIIHINSDESLGTLVYLFASRKIKKIVHAHTTGLKGKTKLSRKLKKVIHLLCRPLMLLLADEYIACSREAAVFMFGQKVVKRKRVHIIPNGVEIEKFEYNYLAYPKKIELNDIENKIIVGHVGRFSYAKNHPFIISVFEKLCHIQPNAELWLIGEGENLKEIQELVYSKNLEKKVKFWGSIKNIKKVLSEMDVLIFPSIYEGFGIVLVEAELNGLPIICSDVICDEAIFTNKIHKMSLNASYFEWAEQLIRYSNKRNEKPEFDEEKKASLNIRNAAKILGGIYKRAYDL